MKKTFKVVMLPAEKASILHKGQLWTHNNGSKTKLHVWTSSNQEVTPHELQGYCIPQHLYILSDEEIKKGDWVITKKGIVKAVNTPINRCCYFKDEVGYQFTSEDKKIVATTDKSLSSKRYHSNGEVTDLEYQLPQLPESFIQAYVKAYNEGKPITEVDLEIEPLYDSLVGNSQGTTYGNVIGFQIKTRPDNTVIVHQSKMYSKDEVNQLFIEFIKCFDVDADSKDIEEWKQNNLS